MEKEKLDRILGNQILIMEELLRETSFPHIRTDMESAIEITKDLQSTDRKVPTVDEIVEAVRRASFGIFEAEQKVKEETEKGVEYLTVDDLEYHLHESKLRTALTKLMEGK